MTIKTIVVPVDGSAHADGAAALAGELAGKHGAKISLVHVLMHGHVPDHIRALSDKPGPEIPAMAVGAASSEPSLPHDVLEDIGNKLLEKAKETASKAGAETVETEITGGPTANAILDHAKKCQADMIVMGSRGLGDLKGLLVGSVSHKVQQLADCNVLTVKK